MMSRRIASLTGVLLLFVAFAVMSHPDTASASFIAAGAGSGRAGSQSIPDSASPIAISAGREVTVNWQATTLSGGSAASSYGVRRYDLSGNAQTVLADCISVTTTTCVEHAVPNGTWRYSVQARMGATWTGQESAQGSAITVSPQSFTLDSTAPITSLPATLTGTIATYFVGETLTYRLDSPTGPLLSGSPSTVTSSSSMAVSVTLPAGTTDAPHSIFVVGSSGSAASASVNIVIPPQLFTMQMRDIDANGKVDRVVVTFDDTLAPYSAGVASWTLTNVPSGGSLADVTVSGAQATLTIAEGPSAANTAVGTFKVALAANSAGIRDVYDHLASFAATAPADLAAPAPTLLTAADATANGKVDKVTMTFSEPLATYTAPATVWTLANVPSGGTLGTVVVATPVVTLNITEGGLAADTAMGSFTVALAADAGGIRDAAGNLSSFTKAPADGAKPVKASQEMFDDNVDGKVDRVLVVFTEPLVSYTAGNTPWTLSSVPSAGTLNSVAVSGTAATLTLNQGTGAAATAIGSFKIALAANATGIRDAAGNQSTYASVAPTDKAAPALVTLSLVDNNGNGKVDRVTALFSETLTTYTAGVTPWTLANVPSGGTLASATVSSATATLTITEGAGAADTTVGTMTVALATNAGGVRDTALNQASFTARTPLDTAKPVAITVTDTNGSSDGLIQPGDTFIFTFSEPLQVATVVTSTDITYTDPLGTGNDTLTMAGISNLARTTGSDLYLIPDGTTATFAGSAVTLGNGNRTITVTVAAACTGTGCLGLAVRTAASTYSYLAATTIKDVAGNVATTTTKSVSIRLF